MAFNINKGGKLGKYFYSKNGVEYGPIELSELLNHIEKDTLVYFQGISWTKASEIPELKRYFPAEEKVVERVIEQKVVETASRNNSYLISVLLLLILVGGGIIYLQQTNRAELEERQRRQKAEADSISAFNAAMAAQEQLRIQDSILMASSAILDSAKMIKVSMDYQLGVDRVRAIISTFFRDISSQNNYLRAYFADTIDMFLGNSNIQVLDLERGLADSFMRNRAYSEQFQLLDSTCTFERMDGLLGVYKFKLFYKRFSNPDQDLQRFDEITAVIKVKPDFKITHYDWLSTQAVDPENFNN